jgi:heme A synthase
VAVLGPIRRLGRYGFVVTTPSESRHHSTDGSDGAVADSGTGPTGSRAAAAQLIGRPPEVWAGAIFLTLAALPAAVFGVLLAVQPGNISANLRGKIDGANSTINTDLLLNVFRAAGVAILVLALLFLLFSWLTVQPKRGARSIAAALAAVEVVLLVGAMVVTTADPVSMGIVLLAVAGAVLLFLPRSQEFIASRR